MKINFRKALASDYDYLLQLRKETMNSHLLHAGLKVSEDNHLKALEFRLEDAAILLLNKKRIGVLKLSRYIDAVEIVQIQIHPEYQGKGIGSSIVGKVIADAFSKNLPVILSVLKGNNARQLYERLGFQVIGEDDLSFNMKITPNNI